jgi:hypothetical protein
VHFPECSHVYKEAHHISPHSINFKTRPKTVPNPKIAFQVQLEAKAQVGLEAPPHVGPEPEGEELGEADFAEKDDD